MIKLVYKLPPDLTKVDLKVAVLAVKELQDILSPPPSKTALQQALDLANSLNGLDYTQQSWAELADPVTAGDQVLADGSATQDEIDAATDAINDAISELAEWTPAEEFSNGELGVYFDPEDTSTLFQDSAGTTPVTGDGQPVGLMLDKSRGLELGPEIADPSAWVTGTSHTITWLPDGRAEYTANGISAFRGGQFLDLIPGRWYTFTVDVEAVTHAVSVWSFGPTWSATTGRYFEGIPQGERRIITGTFQAREGEAILGAQGPNELDAKFILGDITVRELPGHHRTQDTTAAKPTYLDGVLDYDNVDDYLPWMPPKYTGMISMAIAYRLNSGSSFQGWSSMVGANGNVFGLSRAGGIGAIMAPAVWNDARIRVSGEEVDTDTYSRSDLYDDAISGECIGVVEGVDWNQGNPGVDTTPRQTIRYANQPTAGGTEFAYIEVEKPAFDDLPRLEHWLAKKAGITL